MSAMQLTVFVGALCFSLLGMFTNIVYICYTPRPLIGRIDSASVWELFLHAQMSGYFRASQRLSPSKVLARVFSWVCVFVLLVGSYYVEWNYVFWLQIVLLPFGIVAEMLYDKTVDNCQLANRYFHEYLDAAQRLAQDAATDALVHAVRMREQ